MGATARLAARRELAPATSGMAVLARRHTRSAGPRPSVGGSQWMDAASRQPDPQVRAGPACHPANSYGPRLRPAIAGGGGRLRQARLQAGDRPGSDGHVAAPGHTVQLDLADRIVHALVGEARQSGALPPPYSDALLGNIRELARAHQTTLSQIDGRRLGSTRVDQAVMLKLGGAVRQLTGRPDITEPSHIRLDALLRSSIGEAVLVANLTNQNSAKPVAGTISRLALEYLANPGILRPAEPRGSLPPGAPVDRTPAPVRKPPSPAVVGEPSIRPGTVLAGDTILALCRARDLGVAAATGDAANPPDILRGIDPSRWPQLVVEGRQAVTDLVASVIPMVFAQTRHALNAADVRGEMFVELMGAANRFDPRRIGPERWPTYAWMTLEHTRRRGVDHSGVIRSRSPRPTTVSLGDTEPVSREPGPGAGIEERASIEAIKQALGRLPHSLQVPLLESMQGRPAHVIGEDFGVSESTARRRIQEARDHVRDELAPHVDDAAQVPYETVTDPVLERSQRLFEETFAPPLGPEPGRGPDR
jgi:DNA-directed RNA polymerase specialized sigma24 family protein